MPSYPSPEDILAMKANGYDASTIEDAQERVRRGVETEAVCVQIRAAFAGVRLGGGTGLREGGALDDWADEKPCARRRAEDEQEDWSRISHADLDRFHSSLSFFDAEGMRFHLPAFLIADLHGGVGGGMEFCLTHGFSENAVVAKNPADRAYSARRFALLSVAQRNAVRAFLLHLVDEPDCAFGRTAILEALADYWLPVGA